MYAYSPPPRLGLQQMLRSQYVGMGYDSELHFYRRLLADERVRTLDAERAHRLFVPTWSYHLWSNMAQEVHDLWTFGRLAAWLDTQESFRSRLRAGNASNLDMSPFVFFFAGDRGACNAAKLAWPKPTFMSHFGLQVPFDCFPRPGQCKRPKRDACHTARDVVVPYYHAWDPTQGPTPSKNGSDGEWQCELFFAGDPGTDSRRGPTYSQGVRQAVFRQHSSSKGFCLHRKAPEALFRASRFCLCPTGAGFGARLTSAIRNLCVPLIIQPNVTQALESVLPYERFSLRLELGDVPALPARLRAIDSATHARLRRGVARYAPAFNWHEQHGNAYEAVVYALCRGVGAPVRCEDLRPKWW